MAALAASIGLFGLWKARSVLGHTYDQPLARRTDLKGDVRRLVKQRQSIRPY
jgi:hypothetical protein